MPNQKQLALMTDDNPMGTDGFEFVEFSTSQPEQLVTLFKQLGFTAIARHRSKDVTLFRQDDINFILNSETDSFAGEFTFMHGPCVCAMAFRVADTGLAMKRAIALDAKPIFNRPSSMELNIPAIEGVGGSLLYLVDRYGDKESIYDVDFIPIAGVDQHPVGEGLLHIDHLTHNVFRGKMDSWYQFYQSLFNFREIRYFDIEGKITGLKSRALTSPCNKIRIPINESADDKSQIEEYLKEYNGEGIQYIALSSNDIYASVESLEGRGVSFMTPPPDTYYDMLDERLPGHDEDLSRLKKDAILMDGSPGGRRLLQIFTETVIGPIFFEIIQRKGDEGFGEGNFKALFESMERDQIRRGVL